jgi:hypothetical protein
VNERTSLFDHVPRAYEIKVCGKCRASLAWCPDDGEGMHPRAWCRGPERHLNIDGFVVTDSSPATITVQEVEVV